MDTLIQFDSVHLTTGGVRRLVDVSCAFEAGATAIVGESGAGKSSLLNLIAGQEKPRSGEVRISDSLIQRDVPIYWSPQTGGLWPHWNVTRHVAEVLPTKGRSSEESQRTADEILRQFDLTHRRHAFPGELSMGERSRLSIARALAIRPGLLLMDEPLAHVDVSKRANYWNVIREHLVETNASLVFTTHEPTAAIAYSQQIVCLCEGQVVHQGNTQELYDRPPSERAGNFLGPLNWFEPAEARDWLGKSVDSSIAARPENTSCIPDDATMLNVLSSINYGSSMRSVIEHSQTGERRTIFHRPFVKRLDAPGNVRLEVQI